MGKIHKVFKLHQVFMHNFLWQTEHIYSVCQVNSQYMYYSQKYSAHFGLDVLKQFGLEISKYFGPKINTKTFDKIHSRVEWTKLAHFRNRSVK